MKILLKKLIKKTVFLVYGDLNDETSLKNIFKNKFDYFHLAP